MLDLEDSIASLYCDNHKFRMHVQNMQALNNQATGQVSDLEAHKVYLSTQNESLQKQL